MDGTGYSTSQFGLDERFGDGNASQIGLDLDEDLFLDKHPSPQHASAPPGSDECTMHQGQSSFSLADMEIDEGKSGFDKDMGVETPKDLSELFNNSDKNILPRNDGTSQCFEYNIQTPDLNEVLFRSDHIEGPTAVPNQVDFVRAADEVPSPELVECAQAPSTPGLLEETISATAHESPALSPRGKTSPLTEPKAVSLAQQCSSGFVGAPDEPHSECGQKSADNLCNDIVCDEVKDQPVANQVNENGETLPEVAPLDGLASVANTDVMIVASKLSAENILEPGMPLTTNNTLLEDNAEPSVLGKQDHTEDIVPRSNNNAPLVNTDSHLRSCTSQLNQANSLSPEDVVLVENTSELSQEPGGPSGTPAREEALHVSESSFYLQGEDFNMANAPNTGLEVHQQSEHVPGVSKPNELSSGPISKDTPLDQLNCSSSSEFPEPEKMLLAPAGIVDQANELGQLTSEKGIIESDGSVNRLSSLSGKKRRLMDGTPILRNGTSTRMSGKPRIRRNTDFVPDDDDLLASILVGKRTPVLRIGPTPPPTKAASLKRPRVTTRLGTPKRKVLLDDTTVLHADAIRQQLINTEDIRRMRKKAPCTRPDIWIIEKSLLEDEVFNESIITGASVKLNSLHSRRYDSEIDESHYRADPLKEVELSRSFEFVRETNGKEMAESIPVMPDKVDGEIQGPSGTSVTIERQFSKDSSEYDAQEHLRSLPDLPQLDLSNNNPPSTITMAENNVQDRNAEVHMSIPTTALLRPECEITTDNGVEEIALHKNEHTAAFSKKIDDICMHSERQSQHESIQLANNLSEMNNKALYVTENTSFIGLAFAEDETRGASVLEGNGSVADAININCQQDAHADVGKNGHDETLVSVQDSCLLEVEAGLQADLTSIRDSNCSIPDVGMENGETADPIGVTSHQTMEGKEDGLDAKVQDGAVVQKDLNNEVNPFQPNTEIENVPSAVGENSGFQELNVEGGMDVESAPMEVAAAKECSDFSSAVGGNDTEFLNVDDEADYDDAADHDLPNPEEAQSLEYSGWSSRTRGVARYLKTLFDEESGRGRKIVAMDHLLVGKTRKEASRMFFETLVLKTRDYIHAEQENPFESINIKPRIKLLKSEF
ncbi:sister chromatid cohesion 1 protein 4-like isoform X2 [Phoenix dactylifera]|nr:sister chromatid cohesion 1 protein 4-like isoform X2 [Phoenix dactylifera]XP_038984146.1 sister chromatid cohesion 1 protein 4-like isoform X2 [Phoenix dactylifera]